MTAAARPDDPADDPSVHARYPSPADKDVTIRTKCMQLRDAGLTLRAIAQRLHAEHDVFDKPPSATSVAKWADEGEEEWELLFPKERAPVQIQKRQARQLHRLRGRVEEALETGSDKDLKRTLLAVDRLLAIHRDEAKLHGTNAPKVVQLTAGDAPAVSPDIAARVEATVQPAALPVRRTP